MLQLTIKEALKMEDSAAEQCIYVYRDGETVFYVGRSDQPLERLMQHLGEGDYSASPDHIGKFIIDFLPESLSWQVEIITVQSLLPDEHKQMFITRDTAETVENDMIYSLRPCLNVKLNRLRKTLPEKYIRAKLANAGVKITEEE